MKMMNILKILSLFCLCFISTFVLAAGDTVTVSWGIPTVYADNTPLAKDQISGVELRYQKVGDSTVNRFILPGNTRTSYEFELPTFDIYSISVSIYDKYGNSADFTSYAYDGTAKKPKQTYLSVSKKTPDQNALCQTITNCRVIP